MFERCLSVPDSLRGHKEEGENLRCSLLMAVCVVLSSWFCFHCGFSSLNSCYNLSVPAQTHLQTKFYSVPCSLRPRLEKKVVHVSAGQLEMDDG